MPHPGSFLHYRHILTLTPQYSTIIVPGILEVPLTLSSLFSNREFATFDDMDEAKEYLVTHA